MFAARSKVDPHRVLDVQPGAPPDVLQRAFRKAVLRHHPDLNPGDSGAAGRLRAVVEAYQTLTSKPAQGAGADRGVPSIVIGCQVRGIDIVGDLAVPPSAPAGSWILANLVAVDACPACGGVGWEEIAGRWGRTERWTCDRCAGGGILHVARRVRVRVPTAPREGAKLRLRGIGLAAPGVPAPGMASARGDAWLTLRLSVPRAA